MPKPRRKQTPFDRCLGAIPSLSVAERLFLRRALETVRTPWHVQWERKEIERCGLPGADAPVLLTGHKPQKPQKPHKPEGPVLYPVSEEEYQKYVQGPMTIVFTLPRLTD